MKHFNYRAGELRPISHEVALTLHSGNSSEEGMLELLQEMRSGEGDSAYFVIQHKSQLSGEEVSTYYQHDDLKTLSDDALKQLARDFKHSTVELLISNRTKDYYDPTNHTEELNNALATYHTQQAAATTQDEKLTAIVSFCRRCLRLHVFHDGNYRLFGMIMMPLLCVQAGLPIPLIPGANMLENNSIEELVEAIKAGFPTTEAVISGEETKHFSRYTVDDPLTMQSHERRCETNVDTLVTEFSPFDQLMVSARYNQAKKFTRLISEHINTLTAGQLNAITTMIKKHNAYHCLPALNGKIDAATYAALKGSLTLFNAASSEKVHLTAEVLHSQPAEDILRAVCLAIKHNQHAKLDFILSNMPDDVDLNTHIEGTNPLIEAIRFNNQHAIDTLMSRKEINKCIEHKGMPICFIAFLNNNQAAFTQLLSHLPDKRLPQSLKSSLFSLDSRKVSIFLDMGLEEHPDIFKDFIQRSNILEYAYTHEMFETVELCLDAGCTLTSEEYANIVDHFCHKAKLTPTGLARILTFLPHFYGDHNIFHGFCASAIPNLALDMARTLKLTSEEFARHLTQEPPAGGPLRIALENSSDLFIALFDSISPSHPGINIPALTAYAIENNREEVLKKLGQTTPGITTKLPSRLAHLKPIILLQNNVSGLIKDYITLSEKTGTLNTIDTIKYQLLAHALNNHLNSRLISEQQKTDIEALLLKDPLSPPATLITHEKIIKICQSFKETLNPPSMFSRFKSAPAVPEPIEVIERLCSRSTGELSTTDRSVLIEQFKHLSSVNSPLKSDAKTLHCLLKQHATLLAREDAGDCESKSDTPSSESASQHERARR